MGGALASTGENRNGCRVLMRKPKVKRALGISGGRWEDNIKINLINSVRLGLSGSDRDNNTLISLLSSMRYGKFLN
jgi:hypothetical protein